MQNDFRHFCRHVRVSGSATPATQNETFQPASAPSTRRSFSASSIDTATGKENHRIETRHVAASKQAFRARLPQIFILCSFKIDVFLGVLSWTSKFATSKSMFRAMHPSIFITSHKIIPRLPRNLHLVTTWRSPDNAIRKKTRNTTRHIWSAAPATQNDDGAPQSAAPATKNSTNLSTRRNETCWMSQPRLPRETRLRDVWNLQKWSLLQNLP